MTLWQAILESPEDLVRHYTQLWKAQSGRERVFYDEIRKRFNQNGKPADFLYLLARCVKACVRYNSNGEFNNSPDNRRLGARPGAMSDRVFGAHNLLKNRTTLTHINYEEVLAACLPSDVIYLDPPYQGVCKERDARYIGAISHQAFVRTVEDLIDRGCRIIISYDGRTGQKKHGEILPEKLGLIHKELPAGRSAQATLLGRDHETFESLYITPSLVQTSAKTYGSRKPADGQLALFAL